MSVIEVEQPGMIERRKWLRASVQLPLRVVDTEDTFRVLVGETRDLSVGGMRAALDGPLFGTIEATVHIELRDGSPLVCQAMVAGGGAVADGWEYRLAFRDLSEVEVAALEDLVESGS